MPLKCSICGRQIANQGAMNAHMQTHKSNPASNPSTLSRSFSFSFNKPAGNSDGNSTSTKNSGNGKPSGGVGVFIFLILIGLFIWGVIVSPGLESGFWQSKIGFPIKSVFQGTRGLFTFMTNQFSNLGKILSGEEVFSFESGGAEIQKKTGLSFGGASIFGESDLAVVGGYTDEPFGVNGEIIVGKLDESIPRLRDVKFECKVDNVNGKIEMDDIDRVENGAAIFEIYNPTPFDEARIPFYCNFDPKNLEIVNTLTKKINTKTVKLSLMYPIEISTRLDIFALPEKTYDRYKGRYDLAFDELEDGIYSNMNSRILSKSKYESDVDISLWFDNQPLGTSSSGKDYTLRFAFKNKNTKNKFKIEKFSIDLPDGMSFSSGCDNFNSNTGELSSSTFKSINDALNDEKFGTSFGSCKVKVYDEMLGGSVSEIVKTEDISAAMKYQYTIVTEKEITLRQRGEDQIAADVGTNLTAS